MAEQLNSKEDEKFCEPCLLDSIQVSATSFCTNCLEYFCNECTKGHRRNKITRQHKTLEENDLPSDSSPFMLMKKLTHCSGHPDKPIIFKCIEHDVYICTTCVAFIHRKCENISEISSSEDKIETESKLVESLEVLQNKTIETIASKEDNTKSLRSDSTRITSEQEQVIKEIKLYYDNLLKKTRNELRNVADCEIKNLSACVDNCKVIETSGKEKERLLEVAKQYGNDVEYQIIHEIVSKEMNSLEKEVLSQPKVENVRLDFKENASYKNIISIGTITKEFANERTSCQNKVPTGIIPEFASDVDIEECTNQQPIPEIPSKSSVVKPTCSPKRSHRSLLNCEVGNAESKINVGHKNDTFQSSVNQMIMLKDGRVLLSDKSNKKLKLLDKHRSICSIYDLNGIPLDMCEVSPYHVAVVYCDHRRITKFSVTENEFVRNGEFSTKLYPLSVSQYEADDARIIILFSNKMFDVLKVSDTGIIELQIRNYRDGQVISVIKIYKTLSNQPICLHNPTRIRATREKPRRIVISECDVLRCFIEHDSILRQMWYFRSDDNVVVDNIINVVIDSEGNPYMCCTGSNNVIQVQARHFLKSKLITSTSLRPLSVAINEETGQLFVSSENNSYIDVYNSN